MTRESISQGFLTVPFVSQVQILTVLGRSATCVSLHSFRIQRRYEIFHSPLRPSSLCAPSPPPARPFGPHQHCLLLQAAQPWPGAFRFLRSAHGLSLPKIQHKNFQYFVSSETRMKAWSQLTVTEMINPYGCAKATNWKEKKPDDWPLLPPQHWFPLGSPPGVSWRVLSFGHTQQWMTPDDPQPLGGKNRKGLKTVSLQLTWSRWYWQQEAITYIKLKEQVSLLRCDFIICPKCQVVNLSAFSQVHTLKRETEDELNTQLKWSTTRSFMIREQVIICYFFNDVLWNATADFQLVRTEAAEDSPFQTRCHEGSSSGGDFCRRVHPRTWLSVASRLLKESKKKQWARPHIQQQGRGITGNTVKSQYLLGTFQ